MDLSIVADYLIIAFFIWYGLKRFIPALNKGFLPTIEAVLALLVALFTLLST